MCINSLDSHSSFNRLVLLLSSLYHEDTGAEGAGNLLKAHRANGMHEKS